MVVKDSRIKIMNEILNGVRVLKLYAWEEAFINSVDQIRKKELRYIRQKAIIGSISNILWTFTPILVRFSRFLFNKSYLSMLRLVLRHLRLMFCYLKTIS